MSKQLIICFAAALAMIIIIEAAPAPNTNDNPDPVDLQKCAALLKKVDEKCVPAHFDLDLKTIENWAHNKTKCCSAWDVFRCIENGATTLLKSESVCHSTTLEEIFKKWTVETSGAFKQHGCVETGCPKLL